LQDGPKFTKIGILWFENAPSGNPVLVPSSGTVLRPPQLSPNFEVDPSDERCQEVTQSGVRAGPGSLQVCQIFLVVTSGNIHTKLPENMPKGLKKAKVAIKYTQTFHYKAYKLNENWDFWSENKSPIWQPWASLTRALEASSLSACVCVSIKKRSKITFAHSR
jgi:hypothetical protein